MTLSKQNPLVRYFNFIFEYLPQDFCTLFWGTLYALSFFWLEIPGKWISNSTGERKIVVHGLVFYLLIFYAVAIVALVVVLFKIDWLSIDWIEVGLVVLAMLVGVSILLAVVFLIVGFGIATYEYAKEKVFPPKKKRKGPSNLAIWWATLRQKYCTKIQYV